jgi:hypothetical protein
VEPRELSLPRSRCVLPSPAWPPSLRSASQALFELFRFALSVAQARGLWPSQIPTALACPRHTAQHSAAHTLRTPARHTPRTALCIPSRPLSARASQGGRQGEARARAGTAQASGLTHPLLLCCSVFVPSERASEHTCKYSEQLEHTCFHFRSPLPSPPPFPLRSSDEAANPIQRGAA